MRQQVWPCWRGEPRSDVVNTDRAATGLALDDPADVQSERLCQSRLTECLAQAGRADIGTQRRWCGEDSRGLTIFR